MKKKLAVLLAGTMVMASLVGCGGGDAAPADAAPAEDAAAEDAAPAEEDAAPAEEEAQTEEEVPAEDAAVRQSELVLHRLDMSQTGVQLIHRITRILSRQRMVMSYPL